MGKLNFSKKPINNTNSSSKSSGGCAICGAKVGGGAKLLYLCSDCGSYICNKHVVVGKLGLECGVCHSTKIKASSNIGVLKIKTDNDILDYSDNSPMGSKSKSPSNDRSENDFSMPEVILNDVKKVQKSNIVLSEENMLKELNSKLNIDKVSNEKSEIGLEISEIIIKEKEDFEDDNSTYTVIDNTEKAILKNDILKNIKEKIAVSATSLNNAPATSSKYKESFFVDMLFKPKNAFSLEASYKKMENVLNINNTAFVLSIDLSQDEPSILKSINTALKASENSIFSFNFTQSDDLESLDIIDDNFNILKNDYSGFIIVGPIELLDNNEKNQNIANQQIEWANKNDMPIILDMDYNFIINTLPRIKTKAAIVVKPGYDLNKLYALISENKDLYVIVTPEFSWKEKFENYSNFVKFLPLDRILLASGGEVFTPYKKAGEWNTPNFLYDNVEELASLKNQPNNTVQKLLSINIYKFLS